ncbi:MAG: hypothetical protein AB7E55_28920 [Pigmentiphaga sp.]
MDFHGYGVSLALFVLGLRYLGTAWTGAYLSLAPFIGAMLSLVLLHESQRGVGVLHGLKLVAIAIVV